MSYTERPSDEFISLYKKTGDSDQNVAFAAQREFAKALELPLRKGVLVGNILGDIFETINVEPGAWKVSMSLTPIRVMAVFLKERLRVIT